MATEVINGTARFTEEEDTIQSLSEVLVAMGMRPEFIGHITESVRECFKQEEAPNAEQLQLCIQKAVSTGQPAEVICGGACLFFAGMAVGSMATAYLVTR